MMEFPQVLIYLSFPRSSSLSSASETPKERETRRLRRLRLAHEALVAFVVDLLWILRGGWRSSVSRTVMAIVYNVIFRALCVSCFREHVPWVALASRSDAIALAVNTAVQPLSLAPVGHSGPAFGA